MTSEKPHWRPNADIEIAKQRAQILARARNYFAKTNSLEVDTPALSTNATSDPHIESIEAVLQLRKKQNFYLHTSPEFCMKRLLCAGYLDIHQICKVFRDGESGRYHQPEFTMLEWYRISFDLQRIIQDTKALISTLLDDHKLLDSASHYSYQDVFRLHTGLDPLDANLSELQECAGADASLRSALEDNRDDWLDLLLDQKVIPSFEADRLTIISHYPISQAALARACPKDSNVADRFEVFLGTHELANGFVELTEAATQRKRFQAEQIMRKKQAKATRPVDMNLIAALESGMPQCAGVAVGIDRILMIACGVDSIEDVQSFAFN